MSLLALKEGKIVDTIRQVREELGEVGSRLISAKAKLGRIDKHKRPPDTAVHSMWSPAFGFHACAYGGDVVLLDDGRVVLLPLLHDRMEKAIHDFKTEPQVVDRGNITARERTDPHCSLDESIARAEELAKLPPFEHRTRAQEVAAAMKKIRANEVAAGVQGMAARATPAESLPTMAGNLPYYWSEEKKNLFMGLYHYVVRYQERERKNASG